MSNEERHGQSQNPLRDPQPPRPPVKDLLRRVFQFFGTSLGIAVLTLLGAVLGSAVTEWGSYLERAREEKSATIEERARELGSIHDTLGRAIIQREIATDMVINAIDIGATRPEIDQLWQQYSDAYRAEVLTELQSHLLVTGHTEDDPNPASATGMEYFWYYLDTVIQGRFDSVHRCLLQVHSDFVSADDPLANRLQKAQARLQACEADGGWVARAYIDPKTKVLVSSVATWEGFKGCLEDFVDLQDLNARLQRRVWQANSWSLSLVKALTPAGSQNEDDCRPDDPVCDQRKFLRGLQGTLEQSCGNEVRGYN
jgi:hypothetical protein